MIKHNESATMEPRASILKDTSVTSATATLEEDLWNMDLDDLLGMPENNPLRRSLSFCGSKRSVPRTTSARTTSDTGSSRRSTIKRTVSFDKVKIRVFERALSDNP